MCKLCDRARASALTQGDREEAERCGTLRKQRLPCAVLTGFLGAGKTTLLNRLLRQEGRSEGSKRLKLVVLENEVGEIGVDDKLVGSKGVGALNQAEEVILMPNGCMCCRVRGDLVDALKRIIGRAGTIDGVILELSGLSQLAPVLQTFFADAWVQRSLQLDTVICLLDAAHAGRLSSSSSPEARLMREQLALANVALINKVDLLSNDRDNALASLRDIVRVVNPSCQVFECSLQDEENRVPGDLDGDSFLRSDAFSLTAAAAASDLLRFDRDDGLSSRSPPDGHGHGHGHSHGHGHGNGHLEDNEDEHEHAGSHDHLGFSTLSVVETRGPLDLDRLAAWLEECVTKPFPDAIVRFKALAWVQRFGQDELWLGQGVYGQVSFGRHRGIFSADKKKSIVVFIGPIDDPRYGRLRARLERAVADSVITAPEPEPGAESTASVLDRPAEATLESPARGIKHFRR